MGKNLKISKNLLRDVTFYHKNRHIFNFSGSVPTEFKYSPDGVNGLECYKIFDSTGKMKGTKHPKLVSSLVRTKQSVNLHVKMYAEGYEDMFEGIHSYMSVFKDPPRWVEVALRKQVYKNFKVRNKRG